MEVLKYLREDKVKRGHVVEITGFPYPTISKWNQEYDKHYRKVSEEDHRGIDRLVSEEFIEFITAGASEYMKCYKGEGKIKKLKGYIKWLRKNKGEQLKRYPFGKSRRVITEILIANDLYVEKADKTKYADYKPRIKRYYPGAQIVIDGKEIKVIINGSTYRFNLEMSKDMKSDAITSHVISDEETAEAVASTIQEHIKSHGDPLSVLIDNSKANLSEEVEALLKARGIIDIKAYPGNAETKGDIEGEFSKIAEKIGDIRINGKTESEIASSIAETVIRLYVDMRNQTPRCSVCDRVPIEMMKYKPSEDERRDALKSFNKRKEVSEAIRADKSVKIPEEKELLITGVIERNRLEVTDIDRFKKALSKYDSKAIEEAEDAFYAYSVREAFEETKRTGQYFVGVVKNKQIEIDQERKKEILKNRYCTNEEWKRKKESLKQIKQEKEAERMMKKHPEKEIVKGLIEGTKIIKVLDRVPGFILAEIKKGLGIIVSKQNWKTYLERMKQEIMSLTGYAPEQRLEMVQLACRWVENSKNIGVKSVTLF